MQIALVSEHVSLIAGGTAVSSRHAQVAELAQALAERGHQVRVYTRQDSPGSPPRESLCSGAEVVRLPAGPPSTLSQDELLRQIPAFAALLEQEWSADPPDVVHAHFWPSGLAALAGTRQLGVPVLQTFHALGSINWGRTGRERERPTASPPRIRLETAISRSVARVLATSQAEAEELYRMGVSRTSVTVVPYGVDVDLFRPDGPVAARASRPRLVTAGRLTPDNGFDLAIRALRGVPDAELLIVGGPGAAELPAHPEARRLRHDAGRNGVADRVRLVGHVGRSELPALLRSADVAVSAPRHTLFGMVALEAMACGVPVVAAATGGLADTVVEGATGELVRPRDPDALAAALRRLLSDPTRLAGYRVGGADRARARYSWPRVAADTEAAYQQATQ
ncbi:MAG TPA: glycosyltransferase [Mycobacteriales bacterium]|nr:glycosyltransferase [Mycobacteriales bacterium]